jgi:sec-independent protein translocase protein TatA
MGLERPTVWLILAVVALALFGYKRLPDASRSVGRSLRIFKSELKGMSTDDEERAAAAAPAVPPPASPAVTVVHTAPAEAAAPVASPPPVATPVPTPAAPATVPEQIIASDGGVTTPRAD